MSFLIPIWNDDEIAPLYEACMETLIWAERYQDEILVLKIKEMLNLLCPRYSSASYIRTVEKA